MKNILAIILLIAVMIFLPSQEQPVQTDGSLSQSDQIYVIEQAFINKQSDVQVQGSGEVIRLLKDDLQGSRHQRLIVKLENNQKLLIAHNIDLAPRVDGIQEGDILAFYGEYEWNEKGGVIHWTHHDPRNRHVDGWLKYQGKIYQ